MTIGEPSSWNEFFAVISIVIDDAGPTVGTPELEYSRHLTLYVV
jgi:hypothetical protein